MNVAVEVVHQERAEDRNITLLAKLIEQVLEVHAGGDVAALPQDIDHFSPHTYLLVAPCGACLPEDVPEGAVEYRRIPHGVPHEGRQEVVGNTHRQLSALSCRLPVPSLCLH